MSKSIIDPNRSAVVELSNDEIARYSRHLIMPEVTLEGQKRIKAASVLCIGTGGLGSPIALYLAAAGIGRIGLVDFDTVDFSNLQRQILHGTRDVGRKKINSARDTIREINPNVQVDLHDCFFTSENAAEIVAPYDIVIDGTDNFPTTTSASSRRSPISTAPSSALTASARSLPPTSAAPATAASIPNPLLRAWFPAAPREAFSACCPASLESCRPSRRSN